MGAVYIFNEPNHDKTNKMNYAPRKTQINLGHPPSLIRAFAVRCDLWVDKDPMLLHADSEDSDQTRLFWVFAGRIGHFVYFVMLQLFSRIEEPHFSLVWLGCRVDRGLVATHRARTSLVRRAGWGPVQVDHAPVAEKTKNVLFGFHHDVLFKEIRFTLNHFRSYCYRQIRRIFMQWLQSKKQTRAFSYANVWYQPNTSFRRILLMNCEANTHTWTTGCCSLTANVYSSLYVYLFILCPNTAIRLFDFYLLGWRMYFKLDPLPALYLPLMYNMEAL